MYTTFSTVASTVLALSENGRTFDIRTRKEDCFIASMYMWVTGEWHLCGEDTDIIMPAGTSLIDAYVALLAALPVQTIYTN